MTMVDTLTHLDTNILIYAARADAPVRQRLQDWRAGGARFAVSAMAWAEFRCGPVSAEALAAWERALSGAIVPVDLAIAETAAQLFNRTGRRSRSLPDCLIAATAVHHGARLATLNQQDFQPFLEHGLVLA